jgi:hypothetical protein
MRGLAAFDALEAPHARLSVMLIEQGDGHVRRVARLVERQAETVLFPPAGKRDEQSVVNQGEFDRLGNFGNSNNCVRHSETPLSGAEAARGNPISQAKLSKVIPDFGNLSLCSARGQGW